MLLIDPNNYRIDASRGDDHTIRFTVKNSSGVAYDVSANSFKFTCKDDLDDLIADAKFQKSSPVANGIDLTNAAQGIVDVLLIPSDTAALAGRYFYDFEMTESSKVYTLRQGLLFIKKDVTTAGTVSNPAPVNEIFVGPGGVSGGFSSLQAALTYAGTLATSSNRIVINILAGVHSQTAPLTVPSWVTLKGAGKGVTIIKRASSANNIAYAPGSTTTGIYADPVLSVATTDGVELLDLSLLHEGTFTGFGAGLSTPVGLMSISADRLKVERCRIEGTAYGWYDKTDSGRRNNDDAQSHLRPVPDNIIGDETYWYTVRDSEIVGHRFSALKQIARHEFFAYGTTFLLDVPAGQTLETGGFGNPQIVFDNWEYAQSYLIGCSIILRCKSTITFQASNTAYNGGVVSQDSAVSDTAVYLEGCKVQIDLTAGGDINDSNAVVAGVVSGNVTTDNTVHVRGTDITYRSGTITAARGFGGIYVWQHSSGTDAGTLYMSGSSIRDLGGSGATARADALVGVTFVITLREPKLIQVEGSRISSWKYAVAAGSPSPTHSQFLRTTPTINYQAGTATFLTAATVAVTLPVAYPLQGTAVTDYRISITGNMNETFWVTGKSETGFTINSSNASSVAVVDWTVTR